MRWKGLGLKVISQSVACAQIFRAPKEGLRILTYHTVGQHAHGDTLNLNTISLEQFKTHLDVLRRYQCCPLLKANLPASKSVVAITFDDGYADNLHIVAPLMLERCIPFTVFVTARFVREKEKGFLSASELKELACLPGVTIGAHGNTHCDLTLCSAEKLLTELHESKRYLEDLLGAPITTMAYPYGAANRRVRDVVEYCGYELAACSYFDVNRPERDLLMLNRSVVLNGDSAKVVAQKIKGNWDWYRIRMTDPLEI